MTEARDCYRLDFHTSWWQASDTIRACGVTSIQYMSPFSLAALMFYSELRSASLVGCVVCIMY